MTGENLLQMARRMSETSPRALAVLEAWVRDEEQRALDQPQARRRLIRRLEEHQQWRGHYPEDVIPSISSANKLLREAKEERQEQIERLRRRQAEEEETLQHGAEPEPEPEPEPAAAGIPEGVPPGAAATYTSYRFAVTGRDDAFHCGKPAYPPEHWVWTVSGIRPRAILPGAGFAPHPNQ